MCKRYDQYQIPALYQIRKARESGASKALIVMAGGLGKTIVSARDVGDYLQNPEHGRVLFLCHTNDILEQNREKYENTLGNEYTYGFMTGAQKDLHHVDILFASFQTLNSSKRWMEQFAPEEFGYIVVDEAHHGRADTYEEVINYFNPQFLLGLTATPYREDGKSLADIFGDPAYELGFVEAWQREYLTPVDYRLVTREMTGLEKVLDPETGKRMSLKELNDVVFTKMSNDDLVKDIQERIKDKENPRMIIFCPTIENVDEIASLYPGAVALHSKLPESVQEENLEAFRAGTTRTIVARDMLNEGIDVPAVDVIVRLRLTQSTILFEQQLARGLRKVDGKDSVFVLDYASSFEQIEQLFDWEKKLADAEKQAEKAETANPDESADSNDSKLTQKTPKFVVTLTGGEFKVEKVDLVKMISDARQRGYTSEQLIALLQKKAQELGRTPTMKDINSDPRLPTSSVFIRVFGTWNDTVRRAGLAVNIIREYSKDELLKALRAKAEELGRTPTLKEVKSDSRMPSVGSYQYAFGTWNNALEQANLVVNKTRDEYSADELLKALRAKAEELGRTPTMKDMNSDPRVPSVSAYKHTFGAWNDALRRVGLTVNKTRDEYSADELLKALRAKAEELGHTPTMKEIRSDPGMPSVVTYVRFFGSWNTALMEASLTPRLRGREKVAK